MIWGWVMPFVPSDALSGTHPVLHFMREEVFFFFFAQIESDRTLYLHNISNGFQRLMVGDIIFNNTRLVLECNDLGNM